MKCPPIKFLFSFLMLLLIAFPMESWAYKNKYLDTLKQKYADEKAIYLLKQEHLRIGMVDGEIELFSKVKEEVLYLKDEGSVFANESLYFSQFNEIFNIKAYTLLPSSSWFKAFDKYKVEAKDIKTKSAISGGIFFDDAQKKEFSFPKVQKNAISSLNYSERYKDPKFLNKFFFISHIPVLQSQYKVSVHKDVEIDYRLFNVDNFDVKFTQKQNGDYTVYTWELNNAEAFKTAKNAPSIAYYAPHICISVNHYLKNNQKITVLPNVKSLYTWYYDWIKDVNQTLSPQLQSIADSLAVGLNSNDAKAKAVFYWVQDHIKYVAFEDGMGGFIPRNASAVCDKRYGDCKDMASIITAMLNHIGVPSYLTWIGSRKIPYTYEELPTLSVDNHMIAAFENDAGKIQFLDAVGTYTPFHITTAFIQGKQGMIGVNQDSFLLQKVPIVPAELNLKTDSVTMYLGEDGAIKGKGVVELKAYEKLDVINVLMNQSDEKRRDFIRQKLQKGSNKFNVFNVQYSGLKNRDKACVITYDFTLDDYIQKTKNEWFVDLNLAKEMFFGALEIDDRNGIPVENKYLKKHHYYVELVLPDFIKNVNLPQNSNFKHDDFSFNIAYQKHGNKVILEQDLNLNILMLEADQFENWNTFIKNLNKAYRSSLSLLK